jgi:phosphate transport system protein
MPTTHHDLELSDLKQKLLRMGSLVESSLGSAIDALLTCNEAAAREVKQSDDAIDQLEKEVDEQAIVLLSKAPLARDLRFIIVAMKISHDLERAGDEVTGVAKQAIRLSQDPSHAIHVDIQRMATMALAMLRQSLDAFVSGDANIARSVMIQDEDVDLSHKQVQRVLISYMLEAPSNITRCLSMLQVAKRLERVADHATNIAEEVIYLLEGKDVRHEAKGTKDRA